MDALKPLENVDGISYWFPEEAGNGDDSQWPSPGGTVIASWQNRGFWDENISQTGHNINKTGTITAGKTAADVCAPYYMKNFLPASTAGLYSTPADTQGEKMLRNGQLLIRRGGRLYNATGAQITEK